jgi:hypothetical protein
MQLLFTVHPGSTQLHSAKQHAADNMSCNALQVMRLHAFTIRKLAPLSSSSSAATPQQQQQAAAVPKTLPGHLTAHLPLLRQRALSLLAAPLAGDALAAEYLLLAALGSVSDHAYVCSDACLYHVICMTASTGCSAGW